MDGPIPGVSLKHLPAGNLHRVPLVHTIWGKHILCKWFFFWNGAHTARDTVLMASVSAKANGCCERLLLMWATRCMLMHFVPLCPIFRTVSYTSECAAYFSQNKWGNSFTEEFDAGVKTWVIIFYVYIFIWINVFFFFNSGISTAHCTEHWARETLCCHFIFKEISGFKEIKLHLFCVCVEAMTFKHKGSGEIKRI